ncbi:MAG: hypothetical protein PV337_00115 [Rickettsiaceae bacterium]|nr:hypothetical protein [Rickettsiaceae bacterium]
MKLHKICCFIVLTLVTAQINSANVLICAGCQSKNMYNISYSGSIHYLSGYFFSVDINDSQSLIQHDFFNLFHKIVGYYEVIYNQ